jgi:hypothetical protein
MVGKRERGFVRILSTACIGASLIAGGWSTSAATASTAAVAPGAATSSGPTFLRPCRNLPSPGDQFGLSKAEQHYIYDRCGLRATAMRNGQVIHGLRGSMAN